MRYGICPLSVVPMRKDDSHQSELVSELLFNDIYEVIEENSEWLKIRCSYDSYEGWIRKLQHREISDNEYDAYLNKKKFIINSPFTIYKSSILSFGSIVSERISDSIPMRNIFDPKIMVESAMKLLNIPYRWGGKSIMGIDCSAFVQLCAKVAGYQLARDASQQVNQGTIIRLNDAQAGDLAFFENDNHNITHVGILLSNDRIIHASGVTRIDFIDKKGIYNKNINCHTHNLSVIKRII